MKKIVMVFDGTHFSEGAFTLVQKMNQQSPVLVAGVFLPQVQLANLWSYASGSPGSSFIPLLEPGEAEEVQKNIAKFETTCKQHSIDYRVRKDFLEFGLHELKKETRFADLLIIGSQTFFAHGVEGTLNQHLKNSLQDAESAAIVVPEHFAFPERNILAYDGSPSCVYAIKQFAYLFAEWAMHETLLVYASQEQHKNIPDEIYIEELAARHFPDLTVMKAGMESKKQFTSWVSEKKNAILVSGAFGRSGLSTAFRKSFVTDIITKAQLPVFIAHR